MNRKHLVACIRSPCTQVQGNRVCARNTDFPLAVFFDQRLKLQLQDRTLHQGNCFRRLTGGSQLTTDSGVFVWDLHSPKAIPNSNRIPFALINDVPQARSSEIRNFNFWIACCIKGFVDRVRLSRWFPITSTDKTNSSTSIIFFDCFLLLRPTKQCYAFT